MKQNKLSAPRVHPAKINDLFFAGSRSTSARNVLKRANFLITAFCLYLGLSGIAGAQTPGGLDATFGTSGKVTTAIGTSNEGVSGTAIQADGKIVAAGYASNGANTDFALARYNADGTLDSSFGTGGKVVTPIGSSNDFASSVAIQTGKIVVAGYASNGANLDFALARYNADGTLDATFGTSGKVTTAIGSLDDFASAIAVQSDGKIVVAGASETGIFSNDFAVVRYNADGTLDATFGAGGKVTTAVGGGDDFGSAVVVQSDGKIVVVGASLDGGTDDFAAVRYAANGTLDAAFGTGGKVVTPIGNSDDFASSVAIQADGKIVVGGDSNNGANADFALVRYTASGTLDATFGTGGKTTAAIGTANDFLNAVAIQANGKIVAVGSAGGATDDFALARFNADGTLDSSFGTGGKVVTPIGSAEDFASSVAIQADGKIIAAGSAGNGTNLDFALARYFGENANNSVPAITALSPNNRLVGSGAFELTVTGSNFVADSVVRFNGQDRATTFISGTEVRAQILAADLQTAGQFPLTVFNSAPGGGVSNALNFTVGACSYSITPASITFANTGGNGSFNLTTQTGCVYTAVSNAPFITVTGGASGSGNGSVSFAVAANTGPARTGTITVGGQTFTVSQSDGCTYSIAPTGANFAAAGGSGSFAVTTGAGCTFTATTTASFITITNGTGTGGGTVTFTVAANAGADRTGTITVNGQTFTVNQSGGCSYSLSPTSASFSGAGGQGSFTVTTGSGCTYSATTSGFVNIISGGTGTNGGIVTYFVARNDSAQDRTAAIFVNGQTFSITQAGGCVYSVSPGSANFNAAGGAGSFTITSSANCSPPSVVSNNSWITVTSVNNGSGSSIVNFNVQINASASRTGTIRVTTNSFAVFEFLVNQAAAPTAARTAFDYDGDGRADVSVFRPSNGIWYLLNSQTGFGGAQFGASEDRLVPADYDNDGRTDLAVYRNGTWFVQRTAQGFTGISFGAGSDIPAPADFDGDGRAELAVFRPSNGIWYLYNLVNNQVSGVQFGASEDRPVAGDYDGDGKADVAVFRPSNGTWYLNRSQAGFTGLQFGEATDKTVPADYDGDGRTDVAVFREGTWFLQRSTAGFLGVSFGAATDRPTPNVFVR